MKVNKQELILFIYPTYLCQGHCRFCFIDPKLKKNKNNLTLDEIKKNIQYLEKKYILDQIALVGGDPLIYENLIPLLDFLGKNYLFANSVINKLVLCTEGLNCTSLKLVNYLSKFFGPGVKKINSSLQVSLNSFNPQDKFFEQRKKAILNLAKNQFNLHFVIVFTKQNIQNIPQAINFLLTVFNKYYKDSVRERFKIELRLPFNIKYQSSEFFVPNPKVFLAIFQTVSDLLFQNKISFLLRNIPLCYLKNRDFNGFKNSSYNKIKINRKIARLDKLNQFKKIKIETYSNQKWGIQKNCSFCKIKDICNGITLTYIRKFKYPQIKPFKS